MSKSTLRILESLYLDYWSLYILWIFSISRTKGLVISLDIFVENIISNFSHVNQNYFVSLQSKCYVIVSFSVPVRYSFCRILQCSSFYKLSWIVEVRYWKLPCGLILDSIFLSGVYNSFIAYPKSNLLLCRLVL